MDQVATGTKTYLAEVHLGVTTDTLDAEGSFLEKRAVPSSVTQKNIPSLFSKWTGDVVQTVPKFSAVRQGGKRLYELARMNQAPMITLPSREVTIYSIDLRKWVPPKMTIEVNCGKGTYIRQLAADLGEDLGCGAHLSALRRTRVGFLSIENAVDLTRLRKASHQGSLSDLVVHPRNLLRHIPSATITRGEALALSQGKSLSLTEMKEAPACVSTEKSKPLAAYVEAGDLVAIATLEAGFLKPKKVFWRP